MNDVVSVFVLPENVQWQSSNSNQVRYVDEQC